MDRGQAPERASVGASHEDAGYRLIVEQVRRHFGLDLAHYRYDQLHRRLLGFARRRNVKDLTQYAQLLADDPQERDSFVHRFAINVSEFFRDVDRFETLEREILPRLIGDHERDQGRLRIWSAGCSGGHEPYSIAMLLTEAAAPANHHLLATDIDATALAQARASGPYAEKEIRNVTEARRHTFMQRDEAARWRTSDQLRGMVTFQRHDLLQDPIPSGFDLIVCRNVLIYFTEPARQLMFARLAEALRPGGVLFVGATEALAMTELFGLRPLSFGFYVREGSGAAR
jgi:chemotaxis protein methyltransferase CheR